MDIFRLKAIEQVLNGIAETSQIVTEHEVTLCSFDSLPSLLEKLRGVHSQLLVRFRLAYCFPRFHLPLVPQPCVFDGLV